MLGQSEYRRAGVRPGDPDVIYCATGEANISPDCYPGNGLYLSRDGGGTWEQRANAENHNLPRRVGVLLPTASMLYLGGVTLDEFHPAGLYRSPDGGKNWVRENSPSGRNYWCHSLAAHPEGFLLAGLELAGAQTGIWRGGDDGAWRQVHGGLPPGDKTGRISLAMSRSHPDTVYALVSNRLGSEVLGVYRSRNGGERWQEVGGTHFAAEGQSAYNNTIAVHPDDPDTVVCGLNDIHISRDGGRHVAARQPVGCAGGRSADMCTPTSTRSSCREATGSVQPTMAAWW